MPAILVPTIGGRVAKRRNSYGLVGFGLLLIDVSAARVIADELWPDDPHRARPELLIVAGAVLVAALTITGIRAARGWGRSDVPPENWSPHKTALRRAGAHEPGKSLDLPSAARLSMGIIVPASLLVIFLLFLLAEPPPLAFTVAALAVIGALTGRIWRMRIRCAGEKITVHGPLLNRSIPVEAIVAVTYGDSHAYPAVWWRWRTGVLRCTRLHGFWTNGGGTDSTSTNALQLARLMGWITANRDRDHSGLAR